MVENLFNPPFACVELLFELWISKLFIERSAIIQEDQRIYCKTNFLPKDE